MRKDLTVDLLRSIYRKADSIRRGGNSDPYDAAEEIIGDVEGIARETGIDPALIFREEFSQEGDRR